VRWRRAGSGKSGGVRVIYYYHDASTPLLLITIYGKGVKENLSEHEKKAINTLIGTIQKQLREGSKRRPRRGA
jgi:hypothetical protein